MEKWLTESNSQRKNILENQKEILHYKVMKPVLNIEKKPSPVVIVFDRKEIKQLYNQGISTNTVYIFKLNLGKLQKYEGCRKCNCSSVL